MMLFQLIPHILAVQLGVKDNVTWEHGPEYNFVGFAKMITSLHEDMGISHGTGVYYNLKCRVRDPDSMRCQLMNSTITRLKPVGFSIDGAEPDENDTQRVFNIIKVPFEIKFTENGIDSFITERKEAPAPWSLNEVRLITSQLNIGVDLSTPMGLWHETPENFTMGLCDVDYTIMREPNEIEEGDHSNFHLLPVGSSGGFEGRMLITKKRMKKCRKYVEPFFGSRFTLGLLLRDVFTKLKSSESRVIMSKQEFASETINESEVYDQHRQQLGKVLDHIKLTLESVTEAQDEIAEFSEPLVFGGLGYITENIKY